MGLLSFGKKKKKPVAEEERGYSSLTGLGFNAISSYKNEKAMRLSAVYGAVNMISNSLALLPMKVVKYSEGDRKVVYNSLWKLLNTKPDVKLNHFNFIKMMAESFYLKGNAYAIIVRDDNLEVTMLRYVDADYVTPIVLPDGSVKYLVSGMPKAVEAVDMIHIVQHPDESFRGQSTIKYASDALKLAGDTEKHAENFFKSGANLSGVLKSAAPLTNEQKKQIRDSWVNSFDSSNNRVSIAVLPQGVDYQAISVNAEDAELLESRKYNSTVICRFFNISPVKLFDYSNTSYSSLEQVQLSYMSDTIMPVAQMFLDEFNLKLFKPSQVGKYRVEFDYASLLQTDKDSEVKYYRELLVNGILSYNEVRGKLGYEPMEDGDRHIIQLSYAGLDDVLAGKYVKDEQNDNKVDTINANVDDNNEAKVKEDDN